jgi:hypothetical protein
MQRSFNMTRRGAASLVLGIATGLLLPSRARAAALQITPVLIELLGGQGRAPSRLKTRAAARPPCRCASSPGRNRQMMMC